MRERSRWMRKPAVAAIIGLLALCVMNGAGVMAEPDPQFKLGETIYKNPLSGPEDVEDWVIESKKENQPVISTNNGRMRLMSDVHFLLWCPKDFPDSFVAEWDVRILSDLRLCIIFFAAKGKDGKSIFHPSLPDREGNFVKYVLGAIRAYHVSYYAAGRVTSNLRKDGEFYMLDHGPIGILKGSKDVHHVRLIKDKGHIQLQVDGKVSIDFTDTGGERYGPRYRGGKIGLRQMVPTVGLYRNFRVWELEEDEGTE